MTQKQVKKTELFDFWETIQVVQGRAQMVEYHKDTILIELSIPTPQRASMFWQRL